jgi:hypothetical protein
MVDALSSSIAKAGIGTRATAIMAKLRGDCLGRKLSPRPMPAAVFRATMPLLPGQNISAAWPSAAASAN